jgi:hypothetical protein
MDRRRLTRSSAASAKVESRHWLPSRDSVIALTAFRLGHGPAIHTGMINPAFPRSMFLCGVPLMLYQRNWWLVAVFAALGLGYLIAWYRKKA